MATLILVHGAWQGAWCWDKLVPLLEGQGHTVFVPNLPGHGTDTTPTAELTFAGYIKTVTDLLAAVSEPVTLIGHSMAGTVITQAAEEMPEKIKLLVYLAAYLPQNGESLYSLSQTDAQSQAGANAAVNADYSELDIKPEARQSVFFFDCSEEDTQRGFTLWKADALAPLGTPVVITEEKYGAIPRAYIHTTLDRVVSYDLQQRMTAATPCDPIFLIESGHTPYLSHPDELADILHVISSREVSA